MGGCAAHLAARPRPPGRSPVVRPVVVGHRRHDFPGHERHRLLGAIRRCLRVSCRRLRGVRCFEGCCGCRLCCPSRRLQALQSGGTQADSSGSLAAEAPHRRLWAHAAGPQVHVRSTRPRHGCAKVPSRALEDFTCRPGCNNTRVRAKAQGRRTPNLSSCSNMHAPCWARAVARVVHRRRHHRRCHRLGRLRRDPRPATV